MDIGDSYAAVETRLSRDDSEARNWDAYPKKLNISSRSFYANFHAHKLHYLVALQRLFRKQNRSIIWLAGDSSLDNKHWLYELDGEKMLDSLSDDRYTAEPVNGYEKILRNPCRSIRDVCYWVNEAAVGSEYVCLNTSIEASTLKDRMSGLLGHDELIRDRMQPQDVLIVSIGGESTVFNCQIQFV